MSLTSEEKEKRQNQRKQKKYNETHKMINGVLYKFCNHHKEYFPEEDEWLPCTEKYFYKNKSSGLDGLNTWCKKCGIKKARKRTVQWEKENPELAKEKYISRNKNLNERERQMRRDNSKKRRENGYDKQYRHEHPDKFREYSLNRANKNHIITNEEWKSCKEYFNYTCAYCGVYEKDAKEQQGQYFHKEHVNHNGANDLSNCVPSCKICNSQKWEFDMEEWYKKQDFFSQDKLDKINKWLSRDYKQFYIEKENLPYIIKRERNENNLKRHYELWSLDKNGGLLECLVTSEKREDLNKYIEKYYN